MPVQYNYDLIRDYLHGLVDKASAKHISELIASDETARSIAEGILILENNFKSEAEVDAYLENFRQKQMALIGNQTTTRKIALWMKVAASILLIGSIGFVVQLNADNDAMAIVDQELANPYPVSTLVRGESGSAPLETALDLYNNKKYTEALAFFEEASKSTDDLATTAYYQGLTHLYIGNYQEATGFLTADVIKQSRYAQQARWASALATLKLNNRDKARTVLTLIVQDPTHYKYDNAVELLESFD